VATLSTRHRKRSTIREFAKWGVRNSLWRTDPTLHFPTMKQEHRELHGGDGPRVECRRAPTTLVAVVRNMRGSCPGVLYLEHGAEQLKHELATAQPLGRTPAPESGFLHSNNLATIRNYFLRPTPITEVPTIGSRNKKSSMRINNLKTRFTNPA
jgi:hypothetical protein